MEINSILLEDYKLKTAYLNSHFSRMLTRFNFFLTINSALFALSLGKDFPPDNVPLVSYVGIALSVIWFFFGATDNFLASVYREKITESFELLKDTVPDKDKWRLENYLPVGDLSDQKDLAAKNPLHFRISWLSVTDLGTLFALTFLVIWIIRMSALPG